MATRIGTSGTDTLNGTSGNDLILGNGGTDTLNGNGGADVIISGPGGSDTISGGAGADKLVLDGNFADYTVTFSGSNVILTNGSVVSTVTGVEQLVFEDVAVNVVGAGSENATIQQGVDASDDGEIVLVADGTYVEQVTVDGKSDLTIIGTGATLKAPADVVETVRSSSDREIHAVLTVKDSTNVEVVGLTVDGDGRANTVDEGGGAGQANYVGVMFRNASGTLTDVDVTGVRDPLPGGTTPGGFDIVSGVQRGVGVQVDNDTMMDFTMTGGSIVDFQKNATVFNRADLNVSGVTITGGGDQTINAQNGIQVLNSTGTINNNTITDIGYAGPATPYSGAILAYGNTGLSITDNTITGSNDVNLAAKVVGIYVFDFGTPNSDYTITGNTISHVDTAIDVSGGVTPDGMVINSNTVTDIDTADPFAAGISVNPDATAAVFNVTGTDFNDFLKGGSSADTFVGGAGNDTLDGQGGMDSLTGGTGDDTYVVDASGDTVIETAGEGSDTIDTSADFTLGAGVSIETLNSTGTGVELTGNELAQDINADAGDNTVTGGGGNDTLDGGEGTDTAVFSGTFADYSISGTAASFTITDLRGGTPDGIDQVDNFETLDFTDVDIDVAAFFSDVKLYDAGNVLVAGYTSIQDAVDDALDGYRVEINAGTYVEDVLINGKAITIDGAGAGTDIQGQFTVSGTIAGEVKFQDIEIDATGKQYGIFVSASGTSGELTLDGVNIANAQTNGLAYIRAGNGSAPTLTDTFAEISLLNSNFSNNATVNLGSNGRGDVILFGFNGDLTLNNVDFSSPGAQAQKALQMRGVQDAGDTAGVGPYDPAGDLSLTNVTVSGTYLQDAFAFYRIASFASTSFTGVDFTGTTAGAAWGLINFDSVGGAIDLSSIIGTNGVPGLEGSLQGLSSADTFTGTANDDLLLGRGGADTLVGGAGHDFLNGGTGVDSMTGGQGNDTFTVDDTADTVSEAAGEGTDTLNTSANYTLAAGVSIEFMNSTGTGVSLTGNALAQTITGDAGNNTLTGGGGGDTINGGAGNDTINGGTGADILTGGLGNDVYAVDNTSDTVTEASGEGTDTVNTSAHYTLAAGVSVEFLNSTGTGLNLTGNAFSQTITGDSGANTINGGGGGDTLIGLGGTDSLTGGAGNDTLDGGTGDDTMVGGADDDVYSVDSSLDVVTELAGEGTDLVQSSVTYTLAADLENLTLTGSANIDGTGNGVDNVLTANSGNNVLNGGAGNDTISGGAGNDSITGGLGVDAMSGGAGNDSFFVDDIGDTATELSGEGTDLVTSSVTFTLGAHVENLTLTGATAINGTGNELNNIMTGNTGVNTMSGGAGNDLINGGFGADTLIGGEGNDTFLIENAGDTVVEAAGEGTDQVNSAVTHTLGANVENLTLTGAVAINGTGNGLDNTIIGNGAANTLSGGGGNDTINGGLGADTMSGGAGNDAFVVDNAGDTVTEASGEGTDRVSSSVTFTLSADVENLTLTGTGAINGTGNGGANEITGNAFNNILTGGAGNDTLSGANGDDRLVGGGGNDSLTGGAGADRFVYSALGDGVDLIFGFTVGSDKIAVDDAVFGASFSFVSGAAPVAAGPGATFLYNTVGAILSYDADGNGAGAAVVLAEFQTVVALTASDFEVF
jgi:Ca2+-binding RTX toxin-like protein